jgi:hypothetical protein
MTCGVRGTWYCLDVAMADCQQVGKCGSGGARMRPERVLDHGRAMSMGSERKVFGESQS